MDIIDGIGTMSDGRGVYLCDHDTSLGQSMSLKHPVLDTIDGVFISTEWCGFLAYHLDTSGLHIVEMFLPYYLNGHHVLN
jgi:hypothetical protein